MKPAHSRPIWYATFVQVFDRQRPDSPLVVAAVATGGAIGAAMRWLVAWTGDAIGDPRPDDAWPWATLAVNLAGAALIGLVAMRVERNSTRWAFLVTGVLGGFTTFSALAVEVDGLVDAQRAPMAAAYAGVTLLGGAIAVSIGSHTAAERPDAPAPADGTDPTGSSGRNP